MGFRFRKSFTIIPGVRLTLTHRGISLGVGPREARLSATSRGRITRTFSIPGLGLSHVKTVRSDSPRASWLRVLFRKRR